MWKLFLRRISIRENWANVHRLSFQTLLAYSEEIAKIPVWQIREQFGREIYLKNFLDGIVAKQSQAQIPALIGIVKNLVKNTDMRNTKFIGRFWEDIALEFIKRSRDLQLEELVELGFNYAFVESKGKEIEALFEELTKKFCEFDISDISKLEFDRLDDLLWAFTFKNSGNQHFYEDIATAMMNHRELKEISYKKMAKLASFFSRTDEARIGGQKYLNFVENNLWTSFHQGKMRTTEEIIDIIYYLVPKNIGSNKFRGLLEVCLYEKLTDPDIELTTRYLIRIINAFSELRYAYEPLNEAVTMLVQKNIDLFDIREMSRVIWGFSRFKGISDENLLAMIEKHRNELRYVNEISYRDFSFVLISILNSGVKEKNLWNDLAKICTRIISPRIRDHYLIKYLSAFAPVSTKYSDLYDSIIEELMQDFRLPLRQQKDITRLIAVVSETEKLQKQNFLEYLEDKAFYSINFLEYGNICKILYFLNKIGKFQPETIQLYEKRLLESNPETIDLVSLAAGVFALTELNKPKFVENILYLVVKLLFEAQNKQFYDSSDSDDESLILRQEEYLNLDTTAPATSIIQICWMAAVIGLDDPTFWTDKLQETLEEIGFTEIPFTYNFWLIHSRIYQQDEAYIKDADSFYYLLLMEIFGMKLDLVRFREVLEERKEVLRDISEKEIDGYTKWLLEGKNYKPVDFPMGVVEKVEFPEYVLMLYEPHDFNHDGKLKTSRVIEKSLYEKLGYVVEELMLTDRSNSNKDEIAAFINELIK